MKGLRTLQAPSGAPLGPSALLDDRPLATPLAERIRAVQELSSAPTQRSLRRMLFVWLRIYVWEERRSGETSRVNVRLPIPIPLIGSLMGRRISSSRALALLADVERDPGSAAAAQGIADSVMGFEFIRVVEEKNGKREVVVVGFD